MLASLDKQTFKDFKVYILDGSDGTGLVTRLNQGIRSALKDSSTYIQILHDDDLVEPDFLEECVKRMDVGDIDWVFPWGRTFGSRTGPLHHELRSLSQEASFNNLPAWVMGTAKLFNIVYPLKEDIPFYDWDVWLKILKNDFVGDVIQKELVLYRIHQSSDSANGGMDNWELKRNRILEHNGLPTKRKYRFHHLGIPHLPLSKEYSACAFTQKLIKMNKMLLELGHEVFFYGCKSQNWDAEKYYDSKDFHFIETHTLDDIRQAYGSGDDMFEIGYNWKENEFRHDFNGPLHECTKKFNKNSVEQINKLKKDDDFLLVTQGYFQKEIDDSVKLLLTCEPGIGYRGSYCKNRAFEGSAIRNFMHGSEHPYAVVNANFYDRVIPNYFDDNDIEYSHRKKDYALFIARLHWDKGLTIAYDTCKAAGVKLLIAGQGGKIDNNGDLLYPGGRIPKDSDWEYVGCLDFDSRKKIMSEAFAVFTPSIYLDPFCGTHVEAMLSGTPPITTDYGIFPETIPNHLNGVVGFRCNTLNDFVTAVKSARKMDALDYRRIREYSERFLMQNIQKEFQKWFDDQYSVYVSARGVPNMGWFEIKDEVKQSV